MDDLGEPMPALLDGVLATMIGVGIGAVSILPADASRIVLLISISGSTGGGTVTLGPTGGTGFLFTLPLTGWVEILWSRHGPICGYELSAVGGMSQFIVYTYTLRKG